MHDINLSHEQDLFQCHLVLLIHLLTSFFFNNQLIFQTGHILFPHQMNQNNGIHISLYNCHESAMRIVLVQCARSDLLLIMLHRALSLFTCCYGAHFRVLWTAYPKSERDDYRCSESWTYQGLHKRMLFCMLLHEALSLTFHVLLPSLYLRVWIALLYLCLGLKIKDLVSFYAV